MTNVIDIADLIHPVRTAEQEAAVAAAGSHHTTLTCEAVLAAARTTTGLDDFGADDFMPRLALWMSETAADDDLTELGRGMIFQMAVTYASNRLRLEDLVRRHPEILEIEIRRPIVVAGLPRSGTTHLQNLLSADPRLRELPMWEATAPVPAPQDSPTPGDPNPRRTRALAEWHQFDALLPLTKNIHEMSPDYVAEDVELQSLDFGSYNLEWRVHAPQWRDHYLAMDHTSVYRYMKKALQALTFLRGGERWVIKCPQHMERLVPLFRVFPDATVAITHRDPVASIQSALVGFCYISRITRHRIDAEKIAGYWIDRYRRLLDACVRDRDVVPQDQIVDVFFNQLVSEPLNVIGEIYKAADLTLPESIVKAMHECLTQNEPGKHGRLAYDLQRDFGLTAAQIRPTFANYLERFPVPAEVA